MVKSLGVVLVLAAIVTGGLFLATGAGVPGDPGPLPPAHAHLAGSPLLALGAGIGLLVGLLLVGTRTKTQPYATLEVVLLASVAAGVALSLGLVIGVSRNWQPRTLAAIAGGGALETLAAVGIAIRLAVRDYRRRWLFVPGVIGAALLAVFYLVVILLGVS